MKRKRRKGPRGEEGQRLKEEEKVEEESRRYGKWMRKKGRGEEEKQRKEREGEVVVGARKVSRERARVRT